MDMIRLAMSSSANTSIVQMQDILDLGSEGRMNTPATTDGNWAWRVKSFDDMRDDVANKLRKFAITYGRFEEKSEKKN